MYQLDQKWLSYYTEIDPEKRQEIFKELTDCPDGNEDPKDAALSRLRRDLFTQRHTMPGREGTVDRHILCVFELFSIGSGRFGFKKQTVRLVKKQLENLGFGLIAGAGDEGRGAVYWEIRNGIRRYLSTCTDESYGKKLFGLVKASDDEKMTRITNEMWMISEGVRGKVEEDLDADEKENLSLYCRAVRDEYCSQGAEQASMFDGYGSKRGSGDGRR